MWSSMNPFLVHLIFLMVMSSLTNGSEESNNTSILFEDIFKGYNKLSYPKKLINFNKTVRVEFDFQLINILDVSARNQYIKTYAWVNQYWTNELLTWDPAKYGGIEEIHVDPNAIWVPDILLYSNIDEEDRYGGGRYTYKANVALRYDGRCTWLNPAIYKSICSVDVTFFPFDDQQCTLKFGSWSFDISKIDLHPQDKNVMNNNYIKNGEWCIRRIHAQRNRKTYKCCVHDFVDVTVTIDISRVSLDYITKLIIPCSLISSMIFLGFVLPPESGERIGLSITVLLAMTVFQQLTSELMPSYGFPLLGQYYFATMMEIGASLAVTTFILNFYHRSTRRMPHCLRKIILVWLSRVAFPFSKSRRYEAECGGYANKKHSDANQESPEESDSYSRVENLIDSNDYVSSNRNLSWGGVRDFTGSQFEMRPTNSTVDDSYSNNHNSSNTPHTTRRGILRKSRRHKSNRNGTNRQSPRKRKTSYFVSGVGFGGLSNHEDTQTQYISPEQQRNQNEWMRAARVLDRLFLIISVVIGTVTLFAIFLRAPRFSLDYDNSQCSTT